MEELLKYLRSLEPQAQADFASRCGTTVGYLRKGAYVRAAFAVDLCLAIAVESGGAVKPEQLRPDLDWPYLRAALASTAEVGA